MRNFPLYSIHPQAEPAAQAAECAGELGAYWQMHDALFERQAEWSGSSDARQVFEAIAEDLSLDGAAFATCLDEGRHLERIAADYQAGIAEGITGTPAFDVNGALLSGALSFADFQQEIEYYLAGGQPPTMEVAADSYRSMGQADAPVVVTEFSDYQCPACGAIAREVIPEFIKRYVDTGMVRFVFREFPLSSIHPNAQKAAEAAVCAGQQGQYWEMNEKLFATQEDWSSGDPSAAFKGYAQDLGLDAKTFGDCLDSGAAAATVKADLMAGEMAGVNATPFFFIGDFPIRGGLPIDTMGRIIEYVAAGGEKAEIVPTEADFHVRGVAQTARAITVAFVDYASPESRQHALEILPELMTSYVDQGQMLYVVHPWSASGDSLSALGAAAAECAGEQNQYWAMHDQLFEDQDAWSKEQDPSSLFEGYAQEMGLDSEQFDQCLGSDWAKLRVEAGNVVAAMYGVPGAPVFLFNNGTGQEGSPTIDEFKTIVDSILNP